MDKYSTLCVGALCVCLCVCVCVCVCVCACVRVYSYYVDSWILSTEFSVVNQLHIASYMLDILKFNQLH